MTTVSLDSIIDCQYSLILSDGQCFEKTDPDATCKINIAQNNLPSTIVKEMIGMAEGEEKCISLSPKDAYGLYYPQKVLCIDKRMIDGFETLCVGELLELELKENNWVKGMVKEVRWSTILFDTNHPLAGKGICFDFKIVTVSSPN